MKSLIYYPSFEFTDEQWLKFALLYIGEINPIIPDSGDTHLSDLFHRINYDTDLIKIHRPHYSEGEVASLKALETIDSLLQNTYLYYGAFKRRNTGDWENKHLQDYTIFHEKFNTNFYNYCLNKNLGHSCVEGLKVHKELAYLYMTILADYIAESNGTSIITDKAFPEKLSIIARQNTKTSLEKTTLARSTIELRLPSNLSEISIDELIELRNKQGFRQKLDAFHVELDKFYDNLSEEKNSMDFVKTLQISMEDLWAPISKLGPNLFAFNIGVCSFLNTNNPEWLMAVGTMLTFAAISGQFIDIKKYVEGSKSKRLARRFLADLGELNINQRKRYASSSRMARQKIRRS